MSGYFHYGFCLFPFFSLQNCTDQPFFHILPIYLDIIAKYSVYLKTVINLEGEPPGRYWQAKRREGGRQARILPTDQWGKGVHGRTAPGIRGEVTQGGTGRLDQSNRVLFGEPLRSKNETGFQYVDRTRRAFTLCNRWNRVSEQISNCRTGPTHFPPAILKMLTI